MASGDIHQSQPSYEHLFGPEHHNTTGLRLGLLAAVTIHLAVFAIYILTAVYRLESAL